MVSHHSEGTIQCLIPKNYLFLTFSIILLQRYESLAEILLTATKSDEASQYIEWLVILLNDIHV